MTSIRYELSEQEAINGVHKVWRKNHPTAAVRTAVFAGVFAFLYLAHHIYRARGAGWEIALYGGVAGLCAAVLYSFLYRFLIRRALARHVRSNPALFTAPHELSFDAERLAFASASMKQEMTWAAFKTRLEDEKFVYLYSGAGGLYVIVPKRALTGASLDEFLLHSQSLSTV